MVLAHYVQPVSSKVQTWAKGEPSGSPLRPSYIPSILGKAVVANFITVPAHSCALQTQQRTRSWVILICPAAVTPLVQAKILAGPL